MSVFFPRNWHRWTCETWASERFGHGKWWNRSKNPNCSQRWSLTLL